MISDERKNRVKKLDLIEYLLDTCPEKFNQLKNGNLGFISKKVDLAIFNYDRNGSFHPHGSMFRPEKKYLDVFDVLEYVQGLSFPQAVEALEKWGIKNNYISEEEIMCSSSIDSIDLYNDLPFPDINSLDVI